MDVKYEGPEVTMDTPKYMMYFTADWCNPCKKVRPIVEELQKNQNIVQIIIVDSDKSPQLVKEYEIKSVPTFLLLQTNKVIGRLTGAQTKEDLEKFIGQ